MSDLSDFFYWSRKARGSYEYAQNRLRARTKDLARLMFDPYFSWVTKGGRP